MMEQASQERKNTRKKIIYHADEARAEKGKC